ncbi:hypothetical protein [Ruegeria marina]|uniref:Uncharacterized protein n=1 Tax=Ruegeria marina TaxID=639004 RepID=A0A1G7ATT9_9RHOB|nr:hypothetical protein [Ruegeria marina]SDE18132.1 hypothetical protein SAMN04488239_11552 [Ruegeria marina]
MILHTDTALLNHRPAHLRPQSKEERIAARLPARQCAPKSRLADRVARLFAFRPWARVS